MLRSALTYYRLAGFAVFITIGTGGCLCPPCAKARGASTPMKPGSQLVLWDGDETGGTAKGWADCDKKPDCAGKLDMVPEEGRNQSKGLMFSGKGPGWIGGGWNFFGWWPPEAGHDIDGYKQLVFWIRIQAKSVDLAPEVGSLTVGMRCSSKKEGCESRYVELKKFIKGDLLDGKWHEVVVPLIALKKPAFDPRSVSELDFGSWAGVPKDFAIYIDDISVEVR